MRSIFLMLPDDIPVSYASGRYLNFRRTKL